MLRARRRDGTPTAPLANVRTTAIARENFGDCGEYGGGAQFTCGQAALITQFQIAGVALGMESFKAGDQTHAGTSE